jgi:tetratricopeptide (TPR) repeat protein
MPIHERCSSLRFVLLVAVLLCFCAPVTKSKDTWVEARSPNFTVISNAGEKEARKVADQFEQFREMFHQSFPTLRVDLGTPLIIFAVKNEDSLKVLLPAYWEVKGRAHPAGFYIGGEDRSYVALQTDVQTENPYQVVYHEYTHAIIHLNFRILPVWFNEGLAEYFGNSVIQDKYVEVGKVTSYHLRTLQQEHLIPIQTLFQADEHSPLYNEQNHTSMFYAESWAIVHYLMVDPTARKQQLLNTFLKAWDQSGDQLEAAQQAFGDLRKFEETIELYARQPGFYFARMNTNIHGDAKGYEIRVLSPAEVEAQEGLFYAHTNRPQEAMAAVNEAMKADANLALAHEAEGFLAYSQHEFLRAGEEFTRAIELHSTDYFAYYFAAEAHLRNGPLSEEDRQKLIGYLETAIGMNPQFAPAYAALANVYAMNPSTRDKALELGGKAALMEPGNLYFATNYGMILVNSGKTADAKRLAASIQKTAKTPVDQENLERLLWVIKNREDYERQVAAANQSVTATVASADAGSSRADATNATTPAQPNGASSTKSTRGAHQGESEWAVEGNIVAAACGDGPGKVAIGVGKTTMYFRFPSFDAIDVVSMAKEDSGKAPTCGNWKGRRVRLYFFKVKNKDKEFIGEVSTLQFL